MGDSSQRQLIDVGPIVVALDSTDTQIDTALEEMFVDIRVSDGDPQVVIEVRDAPHGFDVGFFGEPSNAFMTPSRALSEVVRLINRAALDHDPERLHLHGAALAIDGCGLMLSAPSGTGKTTTAAALVLAGAEYLTDETVSIDVTANELRGFPKPMTIRSGAADLLPELEKGAVRVNPGSAPPWIVPASMVGARPTRYTAPSVVAILERPTDGDPVLTPMRRADACVALVQESLDFDRFGPQALEAVARLCARSHCVSVRLGTPKATASALREMVAHLGDVSSAEVVAERCRKSTNGRSIGWIADDAVRWVGVDRSVVLHHQLSKAVLSIHDEGAEWWLGSTAGTSDNVPIEPGFVEFLQTHEFVRRCHE